MSSKGKKTPVVPRPTASSIPLIRDSNTSQNESEDIAQSDSSDVANQIDFIGFQEEGFFNLISESPPPVLAPRKERRFQDVDALDVLYHLPTPAWIDSSKSYSSDLSRMYLRFNQEVRDYVKYISPTPAEASIRELTVKRLKECVAMTWSDVTVHLFGSFETLLYLPTSDIDLVVCGDKLKAPQSLYQLSVSLKELGIAESVEVIAKTRVPIIKYKDKLTTIHVDISLNMPSGPRASDIVKKYLEEPHGVGTAIRGLMYILKQFLASRHLNEPFTGGVGGYALMILVAAFVKMHPLIQLGCVDVEEHLGVLFIEFLELYGKLFNFDSCGITIDPNGCVRYFRKSDIPDEHRPRAPKLLSLLDPQDATNDVGAGAFSFHIVKSEFFRAYTRILCIFGAAIEKEELNSSRRRKFCEDIQRPNTVLGAILTVRKGLRELRSNYEEIWKNYTVDGDNTMEVLNVKVPKAPAEDSKKKRKRDEIEAKSPAERKKRSKKKEKPSFKQFEEGEFVSISSDEEEDWKSWEDVYFKAVKELPVVKPNPVDVLDHLNEKRNFRKWDN